MNLFIMHSFPLSSTPCFLAPDILFSVLNLCSCLAVREKLSHRGKNWEDLNILSASVGRLALAATASPNTVFISVTVLGFLLSSLAAGPSALRRNTRLQKKRRL